MKAYKNFICCALLILTSHQLFSQLYSNSTSISNSTFVSGTILLYPESYFITTEGEKVVLKGDMISFDGLSIFYKADDKNKKMAAKNIQVLETGKQRYMSLPFYKDREVTRFQRIVALNGNYQLTAFFGGGNHYMFVFDKDNKMIEGDMPYTKFSKHRKETYQKLLEVIKKYFPDCSGLIDKVSANIASDNFDILENIDLFGCK